MKKGQEEKGGNLCQMLLDVEALSVDIMSICLGVLLAIERYPCGVGLFS